MEEIARTAIDRPQCTSCVPCHSLPLLLALTPPPPPNLAAAAALRPCGAGVGGLPCPAAGGLGRDGVVLVMIVCAALICGRSIGRSTVPLSVCSGLGLGWAQRTDPQQTNNNTHTRTTGGGPPLRQGLRVRRGLWARERAGASVCGDGAAPCRQVLCGVRRRKERGWLRRWGLGLGKEGRGEIKWKCL